MPRALLIAYYFPPIQEVGGFRTLRFAKFLPDHGWEASVLTATPDSFQERVDADLMNLCPKSITIRRARAFNPVKLLQLALGAMRRITRRPGQATTGGSAEISLNSPGGRQETGGQPKVASAAVRKDWRTRLFETIFFTPDARVWWVPAAVRAGWKMIREERPDILYTSGPPHSTHLVGLILNWLTGVPWVPDFRDPWARCPWDENSRPAWRIGLDSALERASVRRASAVVLNTDAAVEEFARHYRKLPASKFAAIPNGYDPDLAALVVQLQKDGQSVASDRPFRLCHAGDLYGKRSILPLIRAIGILTKAGLAVELAQFGNCDDSAALADQIRDLGLEDKVLLSEKIPHREALREMARADLLVAIQPGTALQIPGKLYEMMLFDKPILVMADGGATAELVSARGLGKVAPSNDPAQIAQAIRAVCEEGLESWNIGARRSRVAEFDGRSLSGRLATLFSGVCGVVAEAAANSSGGNPVSRCGSRGATALAGIEHQP